MGKENEVKKRMRMRERKEKVGKERLTCRVLGGRFCN